VGDPRDIPWSPKVILRNALLAILMLLLILFPSVLFNSTYEENSAEVRGWFAFLNRPTVAIGRLRAKRWFKPVAFGLFFLLGALIYAFLSPGFGFHRSSLALFLGLLTGLVAVTLVAEVPVILYVRKRHGEEGQIRLLAGSLIVAVVCVAVSRLVHFQPGYLYGIIAGASFSAAVKDDEQGRGLAVGSAILLAVSIAAWLLWIPVKDAANQPGAGLPILVLDAVLVAIFVTGVEAVVIGLMPLRFLDGHKVFRWHRVWWAILFVVGAFALVHMLLRPGGGYFQTSKNTPLYTMLALFVVFGVVSVAFWAYFAFRKPRGGEPEAQAATADPAPGA